jgi:Tol biopolymer transport system component
MTDLPGRLTTALADRYRLERELGQGGMATVYLAEDLKHRRQVAVKVLRPDLAATMGPERFAREIEVAARLQHPHILPLHDSGEADGFFYYVMPYVEGETLRDRLARSGELPVTEAVRLLGEIAEALAAAHQRGVTHRDIKPENIMLSGRHAVVMDFGIAKAVTEATGRQKLTTTGVALGTPAYMAPEQATADPQLDHRVDIYAVGVVAYEMLTGHPPFYGLTPQQTLAAHVTQSPAPVGEQRPGLAPALDGVVMRCLAKRPADRYQTAEELVAALEPLTTPSGGMTPTATRPLAAVTDRRPIIRIVGFAAAAAVVALLGWALLTRSPARTITIAQTAPVTNDPGMEIDPALSPDGSFLAYAAGPPLATRIYVRQVDGGRPVAIGDSTEVGQRGPKWSPDGRRLLYISGDKVMVVPSLGGQARVVAQRAGGAWGADWSPDGREIAFIYQDSLCIVQPDSGSYRALPVPFDAHSPRWSPDGKWVALVSRNSGFVSSLQYGNSAVSQIFMVPIEGGTPVPVTDGTSLATSPAWLPGGRGLLFVSDLGGSRDVYYVGISGGKAQGSPQRVTTGLRPHSIAVSADGRRMSYNLYTNTANIWSLPIPRMGVVAASSATQVTRGNQVVEAVAVSADGRWLYYDSNRTGRAELYRIPVTGGEPTQLTDAPGGNYLAAPSPDGKEILFQSQRNGTRDIFLMPAEGGAAQPVRAGPGSDNVPSWFPDGRRFAFVYAGGTDLPDGMYTMERTGSGWSEPRRIGGRFGQLAPDGRSVLISYPDSLVTRSLEGGTRRLLWARRGADDPMQTSRVDYAPDGSRIYFRGTVGSINPRFSIWELPASGGTAREVVRFDDPYRLPLYGSFGSDGQRLFFTLDERESDIWVAEVSRK